MKLKDWADKQGISYLTAWRWFKASDPRLANAYQSDSGTIIVPDESDSSEQSMSTVHSNDVMSVVLKKTVEFSKNNASIEDFAAWILSNFTLRPHGVSEGPKYSRVKPKPEQVQEHFKQFLKPKGEKPKPNMFTADPESLDELMGKADDLTTRELVDEISKVGVEVGAPVNPTEAPEVQELMKDLSCAISVPVNYGGVDVKTYGSIAEGVVTRSVDLTPQQLNYTGSSSYALSNASMLPTSLSLNAADARPSTNSVFVASTFEPTQKEIESTAKIASVLPEKPRRGRKSLKNQGNK